MVFLLQPNTAIFSIFGFFIIIYFFGAASAAVSGKCTPESRLNVENRDKQEPSFPLKEDRRQTTFNILNANKILQKGLQQYLGFREEHLGVYLNEIIERDPIFKDEYDQEITSYYKVFEFIWYQYNETLCENYATKQFENDKLDLCSVARFLSHQKSVEGRESIMKRMGDALGYRCHPCTPYKRKQYDRNIAPNTDHISPEGVSLEESLVLCKDYDHRGALIVSSSTALTTTSSTSTVSSSTTAATEAPAITSPSFLYLKEMTVLPGKISFPGLDWRSYKGGRLKWAYNCDFPGSDITLIPSSTTKEECRDKCYNKPECTHFHWNGYACALKHFEAIPTADNFHKLNCGWISDRISESEIVYTPKPDFKWNEDTGGMKWAEACQYHRRPHNSILETHFNKPADFCRAECVALPNCTNFNWERGECELIHFNDSSVQVYNFDGTTCGSIYRSKPIIADGGMESEHVNDPTMKS